MLSLISNEQGAIAGILLDRMKAKKTCLRLTLRCLPSPLRPGGSDAVSVHDPTSANGLLTPAMLAIEVLVWSRGCVPVERSSPERRHGQMVSVED